MSYVRRLGDVRARRIGAGLLVLALGLVALAGGASIGQAASQPSIAVTVTVLNDFDNSGPGQPTPGGNIGYTVTVSNNGTSTANHLSLSETVSGATYAFAQTSGGATCPAVSTTPTSAVTCSISQVNAGGSFSVTTIFKTPIDALPGSNVTLNYSVAFDSQTNGQPNQKTLTFDPVTRVVEDTAQSSLTESVSLRGEKLAANGGGQSSELTMPTSFVPGFAFGYVGAQLRNGPDSSPCAGCAAFKTDITIPPASTFNTGGPFWNGTNAAPFSWKLVLPGSLLPKGFKLHGVFHDDALLPTCALDSNGNPLPSTTAPGICVATLVQVPNTKTITATGIALSNGSYQFG